jgi:xylose isomerase
MKILVYLGFNLLILVLYWHTYCYKSADLEGKTDFKIQVLEEVEKLRTERAEKQV